MKDYHHFFVIFYALVYTVSVGAMERDNKQQGYNRNHWLNNVQVITAVQNPRYAKYFIENQLIIAGSDAVIHNVNLKTQEKQTMQKSTGFCSYVEGLHADNRKIFYNFSRLEVVKFEEEIDRQNCIVDWINEGKYNTIRSFVWNSLKNTLFICYGEKKKIVTQRNYATGISEDIVMNDLCCQIMTMHPKQDVICMADYSANIVLRNVDDTLSKIKTISLGSTLKSSLFCQYSADGSCIAVGNHEKIIIVDPNNNNINEFLCIKTKEDEHFKNITFHPNGSILAILCNRNVTKLLFSIRNTQLVQYWNIKTRQFIDEKTPELDCQDSHNLCFSDDGSEIVVVLEGKCVRMHVPFAIKDKCIYSLWALKQFKEASLLQDVVPYITNILFEQFRF